MTVYSASVTKDNLDHKTKRKMMPAVVFKKTKVILIHKQLFKYETEHKEYKLTDQ